ncbi:MAG TPA: hypothetical protein PLP31_14430 [Thermoanaerobaculaceae bacterium]|nr:hypothetical protein [Holophagae bacterium]HPW56926.1 hypothetical protein [Thermoanaerobaculaceae bacterium]
MKIGNRGDVVSGGNSCHCFQLGWMSRAMRFRSVTSIVGLVAAFAVGLAFGFAIASQTAHCQYSEDESAAFFLVRRSVALIVLKPTLMRALAGEDWESQAIYWKPETVEYVEGGMGPLHGNRMHPLNKQVPILVLSSSKWMTVRCRLYLAAARSTSVLEVDPRKKTVRIITAAVPQPGEVWHLENGDIVLVVR